MSLLKRAVTHLNQLGRIYPANADVDVLLMSCPVLDELTMWEELDVSMLGVSTYIRGHGAQGDPATAFSVSLSPVNSPVVERSGGYSSPALHNTRLRVHKVICSGSQPCFRSVMSGNSFRGLAITSSASPFDGR